VDGKENTRLIDRDPEAGKGKTEAPEAKVKSIIKLATEILAFFLNVVSYFLQVLVLLQLIEQVLLDLSVLDHKVVFFVSLQILKLIQPKLASNEQQTRCRAHAQVSFIV